MKLICEVTEAVGGIVSESDNGKKTYFIEGIFLQTEIVNRNGRKYPRGMMEQEVNRYIEEMVRTKRATGELGHPEGPAINAHLISHLITDLSQEKNDFIGRAKILNTPNGRIVEGLIDGGVNFGVSSRGLGVLKKNAQGINEVNNYKIATAADIVMDPSAPNAFVRGIMEGAEWACDDQGNWHMAEVIESIQKDLRGTRHSLMTEEVKLKQFERFMTELSRLSK